MSALGGGPEFSADLTSIINRIVISPYGFGLSAGFPTVSTAEPTLCIQVERGAARSTSADFLNVLVSLPTGPIKYSEPGTKMGLARQDAVSVPIFVSGSQGVVKILRPPANCVANAGDLRKSCKKMPATGKLALTEVCCSQGVQWRLLKKEMVLCTYKAMCVFNTVHANSS
jgi:hypothetical protein